MTRYEREKEQIEKALKNGIERPDSIEAPPEQSLAYILVAQKYFKHATLESASTERYFLQAALGKRLRIYKVWHTDRQAIKDDMSLLRGMLSENDDWDPAYDTLDRVLKGAGF